MKKIIYILLIFILFNVCTKKGITEKIISANEETAEVIIFSSGQTIYVASIDGLNLRSTPNTTGARIKLLPQNTELTILEKSEILETIDALQDYWFKVDTGDETGWVFGGYLFYKPITNRIKNLKISKTISESKDSKFHEKWIEAIEGSIEYTNRDMLKVYSNNSKESDYILTNNENIYLIKIEDSPGWYYLISSDYETQGYIYLYEISEKSFYGDFEKNKMSGNYYISELITEYEIIKKHNNIKRYGPLITINHNGKTTEFWNTRYGSGFRGYNYLILDYKPEHNEILILNQFWEGSYYSIYNLEAEEYRCERIEDPYFNNERTYLFTIGYPDEPMYIYDLPIKVYKIDHGFYKEIYVGKIYIYVSWHRESIQWVNNNKLLLDYGEAGNIFVEIENDKVNVVNNLIPIPSW
jgi:hypothetical protein